MQARISGEHSQPRTIRSIIVRPQQRNSHATSAAARATATIPPNAPANIARLADTPLLVREQRQSQSQLESTPAVMYRLQCRRRTVPGAAPLYRESEA